jgi:hypothetical protein
MQMDTTIKELGTVEFSGKVVVSDPGYSRGTWCMKTDLPVLPGRYHVYAVYNDEKDWGVRMAALLFRHEGCEQIPFRGWKDVEAEIGVDSGQCGIFDDSIYPQTIDSPKYPFYEECCGITLADGQAGILQSGKGAVSCSGCGDGSYSLSVIERNGANVALLLDYCLVEADYAVRAVRAAMSGYEMLDIEQIINRIDGEITAFREKTKRLASKEIYDKAYEIYLAEQMAFLLCEYLDEYEDEHNILAALDQLIAGNGFLSVFVDRAMQLDFLDVSNVEKTAEALVAFCEYQLDE